MHNANTSHEHPHCVMSVTHILFKVSISKWSTDARYFKVTNIIVSYRNKTTT